MGSSGIKALTGKIILFTAITLIIIHAPVKSWGSEITVEDYLLTVYENNSTIKSSYSELEALYFAVKASVANQRTFLSIEGENRSITTGSSENTLSAGATQGIDISGVYGHQERVAILNYQVNRYRYEELVNNIISRAESSYWSASMARENILLFESIFDERMETLRITREKYRQDIIPMLDVIRAEARLEDSRNLLTEARAVYMDELAAMQELAGGEAFEPAQTALKMENIPTDIDFEEECLKRPDIQALQTAIKASEEDIYLAAKGLSPNLDAFMGWTIAADGAFNSPPEDELLVSLTLRVPVTDGSRTRNTLAEKRKILDSSRQQLMAGRELAMKEITQAQNRLDKALSLKSSRDEQSRLAEEELRITTLLYDEGLGSQLDLLNAQTEKVRANTGRLDAIKEIYLAIVDIRRSCGRYASEFANDKIYRF